MATFLVRVETGEDGDIQDIEMTTETDNREEVGVVLSSLFPSWRIQKLGENCGFEIYAIHRKEEVRLVGIRRLTKNPD